MLYLRGLTKNFTYGGHRGEVKGPNKSLQFHIPGTPKQLPMKTPVFPCKYHQKGGFSMAMLVLGGVFV